MDVKRRDFLKKSAIWGTSLALPTVAAAENPAPNVVKTKLNIGFIGVGLRGQAHVELVARRSDCDIIAICDIDPKMIANTRKIIETNGKKPAKVFDKGTRDYVRLLEDKNIDAIIIATPWTWHSEMAIAAMKAGKYTGVEVCGGFSLDECWQLVNTHEATQVPLFFLENVCYRRDVMAVLNMVRQNVFGELLHLEGGYQHDLREVKFNDGVKPYGGGVEFGEKGFSEAKWRTIHSLQRNGDLYPTHGVGPIAMMTNINRGNRFLYLTSIASKARGLHEYIAGHPSGGEKHPNANLEWKLGDVVTTIIKANNGETLLLSHDTNLPRPYSLGFRVQGTKGIWMDVNKSIYIEGKSAKPHQWEEAKNWLDTYDHPFWKQYANDAEGAGHGGMDWFLINAFVEAAKNNDASPIDVYDAATWLAITPLSEQSVATGSSPQPFPDFTRGRWTERKNTFAL